MKTLAVLAALAAVATAVPALPSYSYGYRPAQYRFPAAIRREKKSPQLEFTPAVDVQLDTTPEVAARTIALKKPIIVKKKFGYHLYRDSEEEQADPQERCAKEVKVKLCDADSLARTSNQMRTAEDSSAQITENDMQSSIQLAKEAVENLQKLTKFQNTDLGPDAEMHEDIEVARQALEHIQQNFGNLESMNLQATTLSDAEALQNARFSIAKTDNERMAQWKEAIENIQKNAEIAKNIENSFKSTSSNTGAISEDAEISKKMKNSETTAEDVLRTNAKSNEEKIAEDVSQATNKNTEQTHQMEASASEIKETKAALEIGSLKAKEATQLDAFQNKIELKLSNQGKSAKLDQTSLSQMNEKTAEHKENTKLDVSSDTNNVQNMEQPKVAENMENDLAPAASAPVPNSVSLLEKDVHRAANSLANDGERQSVHEKSAWKETHNSKIISKSSENVPVVAAEKEAAIVQGKSTNIDTTLLMKSAEPSQEPRESPQKQENLHKNDLKMETQGKDAHLMVKSAESNPNINEHEAMVSHDHVNQLKSANLEVPQSEHKLFKSADNQEHMHQMKSNDLEAPLSEHQNFPSSFKSADHQHQMKSVDLEAPSENQNFPRSLKSAENKENVHQMKSANLEAPPSEHQSLPTFFKSADQKENIPQMKSVSLEAPPSDHQKLPSSFKSADNKENIHQMKSAILEAPSSEHQSSPTFFKSTDQKENIHQMKSANFEAPPSEHQNVPLFFKSAAQKENIHQMKSANLEAPPSEHQNISPFFKSAAQKENIHQMKSANLVAPPSSHQNFPPSFNQMKSVNMEVSQNGQVASDFSTLSKSTHQHEVTAGMKAAEQNMPRRLHEQSDFQPQGKNWHVDVERNAPIGHMPQQLDSQRFGQEQQQFKSSMHSHRNFEPMGAHQHHHHHMIGHQKFHGKAADADSAVQATSHVNVNDIAGKAAMERNNMMQWKQKEAARGAYGAGAYGIAGAGASGALGAGSGPGAVGVFPGANVGGCAIPLLLSCSPSVVSGSLAKAGYAAPHAYRTSEDFEGRFHNKRDTKKSTNIPAAKVKKTPTKVIQKIALDKKP